MNTGLHNANFGFILLEISPEQPAATERSNGCKTPMEDKIEVKITNNNKNVGKYLHKERGEKRKGRF